MYEYLLYQAMSLLPCRYCAIYHAIEKAIAKVVDSLILPSSFNFNQIFLFCTLILIRDHDRINIIQRPSRYNGFSKIGLEHHRSQRYMYQLKTSTRKTMTHISSNSGCLLYQ